MTTIGKHFGNISCSPIPGLIYIDVPANVIDQYVTVLKLTLDKTVESHRGKGGLN